LNPNLPVLSQLLQLLGYSNPLNIEVVEDYMYSHVMYDEIRKLIKKIFFG